MQESQETKFQSLGWEDPLEKGKATHSSILAWRIPWTDVQDGFRKGRGTSDRVVNIWRIIKKAEEFQKNIYFCLIDYIKIFVCVDHNKLENS